MEYALVPIVFLCFLAGVWMLLKKERRPPVKDGKFKVYKLSSNLHWYLFERTDDRRYANWLVKNWPGSYRIEEAEEEVLKPE
jgi:hypothetical protein